MQAELKLTSVKRAGIIFTDTRQTFLTILPCRMVTVPFSSLLLTSTLMETYKHSNSKKLKLVLFRIKQQLVKSYGFFYQTSRPSSNQHSIQHKEQLLILTMLNAKIAAQGFLILLQLWLVSPQPVFQAIVPTSVLSSLFTTLKVVLCVVV